MTYTLSQLTYQVAVEQGLVREGVATGGSTSTIVDATLRTEADNYWAGGSAWVLYDSAGAGAAPQGEFAYLSGSTSSTGTLTRSGTWTTATASGDRYAVADKRLDLQTMISKINDVLFDIGPIPKFETVTIAANQTEYTLTDKMAVDIRRLLYATTTDSNDNRWREIYGNWEILDPGTAGSGQVLKLPVQLDTSYSLRVDYVARHSPLYAYGDKLDESVPPELVIYLAVAECLRFRRQRSNWREFTDDMERYERKAEQIRQSRPIRPWVQKPSKILVPGGVNSVDTGDYNRVRL